MIRNYQRKKHDIKKSFFESLGILFLLVYATFSEATSTPPGMQQSTCQIIQHESVPGSGEFSLRCSPPIGEASGPVVLFDDNATNGYPGWVVPRKENVAVGAPYNLNGAILGRLSQNETATKTFTLPGDMKRYFHLTISPLMKIDSVDGGDNDSISLKLNGVNIFTQVMDWTKSTPVTINGEEVSARAEPFSQKNLVFTPGWPDEFLYVSLVFEKVGNDMVLLNKSGAQTNIKFPLTGNQFSIQLVSHLNQDINDESFGAANIKGITFDNLDTSLLTPKFPPQ